MGRFVDRMIGRLGPLFALLLVLSIAAPAFASHVCANLGSCAPAAVITADAPSDADPACADCGPACANGCCHASHPAMPGTDVAIDKPRPVYVASRAWSHTLGLALGPPAGPERPPRA